MTLKTTPSRGDLSCMQQYLPISIYTPYLKCLASGQFAILRLKFDIANPCIHSRDMTGAQNLKGHVTMATTLSEVVSHAQAGTCYGQPNLQSLSPPTTKIGKAAQKGKNWGSLGSLKVSAIQSADEFLLAFCSNISLSCTVCKIQQNMPKISDFKLTHQYLASPLGETLLDFRQDLCCQKTRVRGLLCGVVCVMKLQLF